MSNGMEEKKNLFSSTKEYNFPTCTRGTPEEIAVVQADKSDSAKLENSHYI